MKNIIGQKIIQFLCFCVRCFSSRYSVCASSQKMTPAVYIVHHQNLRGPVYSIAWFNDSLRPWVLGAFCHWRSCFMQYYNYTFTKRFGMPKPIAAIIAFPISFFVFALMKILKAVPVYRGSKGITNTFLQSLETLKSNQSIIISPDIDYIDKSSKIGEIYDGFLDLEKYYFKETGKHLPFIPIHINKNRYCIYEGIPVYFSKNDNFKQEKVNVYNKLKEEFLRLEEIAD